MRAKFKFMDWLEGDTITPDAWVLIEGRKFPPGGAMDFYCDVTLCADETRSLLGVDRRQGEFWMDIRPALPDNTEGWKEISFGEGWVTIGEKDATLTRTQEIALETVLPQGRGFIKVEI